MTSISYIYVKETRILILSIEWVEIFSLAKFLIVHFCLYNMNNPPYKHFVVWHAKLSWKVSYNTNMVLIQMLYVVGDTVIQRGGLRSPFHGLTPVYYCACPKPEPWFPTSYVVILLYCVLWAKLRGDCSFCWYWWKCWPSLFKLSFHKSFKIDYNIVWRK